MNTFSLLLKLEGSFYTLISHDLQVVRKRNLHFKKPFMFNFCFRSCKHINISISHCLSFLYFYLFLLDIFFIYISNVIPFPSFPSKNPLSFPHSPCSLTHPHPFPGPGIPLYWGIEPSQNQGPLFPLMTDQAILNYICSQIHESLHVFSLIGGLVTVLKQRARQVLHSLL